jgi:Spy/CpxP family protein refolding chaperone
VSDNQQRKFERRNRKTMKRRIAAIFSISLVLVCGAIFVTAQSGQEARAPQAGIQPPPPPPPPPPFGVPDIQRLSRDLSLTDAQQSELKTFLETERTTMDSLRKKMDDERKQLDAATANGQFDEAQVRALASQQAQTMTDLIVEHKRVEAKIYSVLTEAQRARFQERRQPRGPRPPRDSGRPGVPPPPPPDSDR